MSRFLNNAGSGIIQALKSVWQVDEKANQEFIEQLKQDKAELPQKLVAN